MWIGGDIEKYLERERLKFFKSDVDNNIIDVRILISYVEESF